MLAHKQHIYSVNVNLMYKNESWLNRHKVKKTCKQSKTYLTKMITHMIKAYIVNECNYSIQDQLPSDKKI
jgi:hypothetical protein